MQRGGHEGNAKSMVSSGVRINVCSVNGLHVNGISGIIINGGNVNNNFNVSGECDSRDACTPWGFGMKLHCA